MNELTTIEKPLDAYRMSTDAASVCRDIVVATASTIQGRKFVSVEGWQAIALAHGCVAGSRDVERVEGGVRAIGEVRRMGDGQCIATAEGFVGEDEPTWYGGVSRGKTLPKRADYAIRAMAQTRAISRACRSAFAHVVVMMKANLETTPAAEVPPGGFDDTPHNPETGEVAPKPRVVLDGPYKSPTALSAAIKAFAESLRVFDDDLAGFGAWMGTPEVVELEKQALRDAPELWETGDGLPDIFVPIAERIEKKKRELSQTENIHGINPIMAG